MAIRAGTGTIFVAGKKRAENWMGVWGRGGFLFIIRNEDFFSGKLRLVFLRRPCACGNHISTSGFRWTDGLSLEGEDH